MTYYDDAVTPLHQYDMHMSVGKKVTSRWTLLTRGRGDTLTTLTSDHRHIEVEFCKDRGQSGDSR